MKSIRKILCLLLAVLLLFCAACNENTGSQPDTSSEPTSHVSSDNSSTDDTSIDNSSSEDNVSEDNVSEDNASDDNASEDNVSEEPDVSIEPPSSSQNNTASGTSSGNDSNASSEEEPVTAEKMADQLQRGINLSGVLEGRNAKDYSNWMYNITYYETIRSAGFDHVRITANLGANVVGEAPDYTIDPEYLRLLDIAVNNAIDSGLIAVIDFHGWTGTLCGNFAKYEPMFYKIWEQVAERYQSYPDTLMFELINEPSRISDGQLNQLQMNTVEIIRKTNPTRVIALAANENNGTWKLWSTEFPKGDEYCMISIHNYDTMAFTHQGATWSGYSNEQVRLTDSVKKSVTNNLELCANYEKRTGRTVWISEWGTYLAVADKDDVSEYANHFTKECKRLGLAYCYWEFSQGFGIYNMSKNEWKDFLINNMN